jgi:hypothetical protein
MKDEAELSFGWSAEWTPTSDEITGRTLICDGKED